MTKKKFLILAALTATTLAACGGGGSDEPAPPQQTTSTFIATLSAIDVNRSADQLVMDTGGLPAQGATITITE